MSGRDEQQPTLGQQDQRAVGAPPVPDQPAERPEPGSRRALGRRLERLPYGHPSSPYHDDGERKPAPPRLRHLELAPPAPPRTSDADRPSGQGDAAHDLETAAFAVGGSAAPLSRDQLRIAADMYERFSAMEGRMLFGGYGDSALTTAMHEVEALLEHGHLAPGSTEHALIEREQFQARFAELIRRHPDRSPEHLARRVPGALSYVFVFDGPNYSAGIWQVQDLLQERGFVLEGRRNSWGDRENRRVVSVWLDPVRGLPFFVQFHTTASIEAQHLARSSASLLADPRIPSTEAATLRSDLSAAWAAVPAPLGNAAIGDYRR
jgi:hypothetical protein